jgi:hypothetical protein
MLLVKILVLYYPEDEGRKLLLNAGTHVPVWMISYRGIWTVHSTLAKMK